MKTILLADDEPNIRLLVHTTLDDPGFEILEADNGAEALEIAQRHKPDLVILDWVMPGLTGIEVASKLRKQTATSDIPIIMLTCKGQPTDIAQGKDAGVTTYLIKPFSPMELIDHVQEALNPDAVSS